MQAIGADKPFPAPYMTFKRYRLSEAGPAGPAFSLQGQSIGQSEPVGLPHEIRMTMVYWKDVS